MPPCPAVSGSALRWRVPVREPGAGDLDEPNSNLDSAGEEALLLAIQELKARKTTVILVTHKVNILTAADQVLWS